MLGDSCRKLGNERHKHGWVPGNARRRKRRPSHLISRDPTSFIVRVASDFVARDIG